MTKYRELVNRLNRTEDAVSINGRYPAPGLMSEAARAIESLEAEVEGATLNVEHLSKMLIEAEEERSEGREALREAVYAFDQLAKAWRGQKVRNLDENFCAMDRIRSRSNGEEQSPGSSIGRAVDAHEVSGSSPDPVSPNVADFLRDPGAVHANMLRGTIAVPSLRQYLHAVGGGALGALEQVVEIAGRNEASPVIEQIKGLLSAATPPVQEITPVGGDVDAETVGADIPIDVISQLANTLQYANGGYLQCLSMCQIEDAEQILAELIDQRWRAASPTEFKPDWTLTDIEKVIVALTLALPKHVPGWPGCTDEQMEAVARAVIGDAASSPAVTVEPEPIHNDNPSCHDLVIADMKERRAFGLSKYGTILQPGNGRDFLIDAYQEVLDLAVYIRGSIYERAAPTPTVSSASSTADSQKGVTSDPSIPSVDGVNA